MNYQHTIIALAIITTCSAHHPACSEGLLHQPKQGITTKTVYENWTLSVEEDEIAKKPMNAAAHNSSAIGSSELSPELWLECRPFNPRIPFDHRTVAVSITTKYPSLYTQDGDEVPVALRIDDDQAIIFTGIAYVFHLPDNHTTIGASTGAPEIWQRVLSKLPNASILAMEVQNTQALIKVGGFSAIREKLLATCDAMDR